MKVHVVIAHYNAPIALVRTYRAFQERRDLNVKFYLIDQSSKLASFFLASCITKQMTNCSFIIQRENKNREAGGYWHYINHIFDGTPDIVVFTQDELHQRGMRPKNVPRRNDSRKHPYYIESYDNGGLSLKKCYDWIKQHPFDQIGFGGRRCRIDVDFDTRFITPYWRRRWRHLNLEWYDFFSGACFCVGPEVIAAYKDLSKPTDEDLSDRYFAWMWERMWGTVPAFIGGKLVHYATSESNRIEEYSPDTRKNQQLIGRSISQYLPEPLSVRRAETKLKTVSTNELNK